MFSKHIIDSDAFLDMPTSTQVLYFHLCMRADDEGFVGNPKRIMKMLGSNDDDFKILIAKSFIIPFENSVCVIKHWLIHNTIRMDRFNPTTYIDEKNKLEVKENKAYTLGLPNGNQMETQVKLSKVNLIKDKLDSEQSSREIEQLIKSFETINPAVKKMYGNKTQRKACSDLIENYTFERVNTVVQKTLPKTNALEYMPTVTTPLQLFEKWSSLEAGINKLRNKTKKQEAETPKAYW